VLDVSTSISHYQTKYTITLNHEKAAKLGIDSKTVAYTMKTIFDGINTTIYHDIDSKEEIKINLTIDKNQKQNQDIF
jgi:multidrug efflux pump subunit AcrB